MLVPKLPEQPRPQISSCNVNKSKSKNRKAFMSVGPIDTNSKNPPVISPEGLMLIAADPEVIGIVVVEQVALVKHI